MVVVTACACTRTASTSAGPQVVAPDGRPLCPLTAEPFPQGADRDRPAVAVKIESSPQARPQAGIGDADLVYEEPVEGGLAWLLAVFHCKEPPLAGPVRNAHPADAAILASHAPAVFAHAGATGPAGSALQALPGVRQATESADSAVFQRLEDRPVPHNLFVSVPKLRGLAGQKQAPAPWASFEGATGAAPSPSATSPARQAPSVQYTQGPDTVRWAWDDGAGAYVRQLDGGPLTDTQGKPVAVANVVFLWVPVTESDARDAFGSRTPLLTLTGEGDALVLRNGTEQSGRWTRQAEADPPTLVDRKGEPILLTPGTTWIHLVATDTPVFVR
jgi:hypothetical protein